MIIGISGHRPNRLQLGIPQTTTQLRVVLTAVRKGVLRVVPTVRLTALSALAEGSDRIFAQTALSLGYGLDVLLPFTSADYETTFSDVSETPVYRDLLAKADSVTVHPGSLADSTAAYEAIGRQTVEGCDILVAVWDGKPAAGRGGTPEIIQYALDRGRPVIWIDAAKNRPPVLLKAPPGTGLSPVPLEALALTAPSLRPSEIEKLAAALVDR
jgi:hypothetical protein